MRKDGEVYKKAINAGTYVVCKRVKGRELVRWKDGTWRTTFRPEITLREEQFEMLEKVAGANQSTPSQEVQAYLNNFHLTLADEYQRMVENGDIPEVPDEEGEA